MKETNPIIKIKYVGNNLFIIPRHIVALGKSSVRAWAIIQNQRVEFDPAFFDDVYLAWQASLDPALAFDGACDPAITKLSPDKQDKVPKATPTADPGHTKVAPTSDQTKNNAKTSGDSKTDPNNEDQPNDKPKTEFPEPPARGYKGL